MTRTKFLENRKVHTNGMRLLPINLRGLIPDAKPTTTSKEGHIKGIKSIRKQQDNVFLIPQMILNCSMFNATYFKYSG